MKIRTLPSLAAIVLLPLLLAGCTSVLPGQGEPSRLFTLTPKTTFAENLPTVRWQLTVDTPIAEAGLSTTRIALRHSPVTLEYYAHAEWVDRAPLLVQTLIIESFEATNKIMAVGRNSIHLRSDYNLLCELREFQAEYDDRTTAPPQVRVRINAKLIRMPERTIVGSTTAEYVDRAKSPDLESVVATFDDMLGKTVKRIVEWTLTTGAEAEAARRPATAPRS
jgi:cholesterol transport system auxiliary component